jgi:hypothetical protein
LPIKHSDLKRCSARQLPDTSQVRSKSLGFFICHVGNAGQNIPQVRQLSTGFWMGVEKRQSFALLPLYQLLPGKSLPTAFSKPKK